MEDKRILLQLPYGELSIVAIKKELSDRQVCVENENKMLKADLSECLRMTLEKTQSLGSLIQLRAYEIEAIQHARCDTLVAKLRSRGLALTQGDQDCLRHRLHQELCNEEADFESQNKENIPPLQDRERGKGGNKPPSAITPEQRERMELNRKRALELQAEHKQAKQQRTDTGPAVSITPIRAPPRDLSHSIELSDDEETTPIPFDYCTPIKANTLNPYATLKRTGFKSPFSHIYSPVAPTKLHTSDGPSRSAFTPNLAPHNKNKDIKNPCSRCGDTCGRQKLCLVWNHEGDVQREIVSLGYDRFRWDCCGRLDGQPCFVGPHSRGTGSQPQPRMVLCHCLDAAILKRTRKYTSPNRGRYYFKCQACQFFQWADEAYGVEKDVPLVAPDGVREWEIPYANPYVEKRMSTTDPPSTKRKRLVAALLLQELCSSVQGQGSGLNCNGICSKELAASVLQTVHSGGDAVLWRLQPLTSEQMARRFGWPKIITLADLEGRECEEVLLDMLEHSPLIRSIGIRYQRAGPVGEGDSSVFLDLSGLEGYLHA